MKFRLKAFFSHLTISLLIAAISLYAVFYVWHPAPLAKAVGVTHIFLLMVVIDTILGPVLTFILAKEGKKGLKLDLFIVALLQLSALVYGIYNISKNRPIYLTFDIKRFELVQANDMPQNALIKAKSKYQKLHWGSPQWVAVIPPANDKEKSARLFSELETGIAPSMRPDLYENMSNQWQAIIKASKPLEELRKYNDNELVDKTLSEYKTANAWLPLKAYNQDMTVLIDKTAGGRVVAIVDLRAWK